MPNPQATVIISTYNKFDYLERVLAGFQKQSLLNFEIILADDGSDSHTVELIHQYQQKSVVPLHHIWHEDKGFRKTTILNKAVMAAASDYLIFVDGDCIPHHHFVREHLRHRQPGVVLSGRRVMLSPEISRRITPQAILDGILQDKFWLPLLFDTLKGGTKHTKQGIYIRNTFMRMVLPQKHKGLLGSNFSLYKKDLLDINGFDERYLSPGVGEDTDIEYRLSLLGKSFKSIKNYAIQYHIYHKLLTRIPGRYDLLTQIRKEKAAVTPYGIKKTK